MRTVSRLTISIIAAAWGPSALHATENGQSHADLGYIDTLAAVPLAPGFGVRDDVAIQVSGQLENGRGTPAALRLGRLGFVRVKARSTAEVDIVAAAYLPEWRIPGIDGTIGSAMYAYAANVRAGVTTRLGIPQSAASDKAGFGDVTVVPVFVAFKVPGTDLHVVLSPLEFTAPTGRYDRLDPIGNNVGLNYWSYRPAVALTYLDSHGHEFDLNIGASFNATNNATRYKSGNEAYFTWATQQHLPHGIALGVGGYYYKQIGDDRLHGRVVDATVATDPLGDGRGNRGETFAIGPILSYASSQNLMFQAHWDHELFAYDRLKRELVYARAVLHF